jgi:DNA-binding response OmpR family regulator
MAQRILVVEDEILVRKNICEFLRQEGFHVEEAPDGPQAVDLINQQQFNLVICDFVVPKLDGLKIVDHLRWIRPQTPIIFVTAYLSMGPAKALLGESAEFIQKPFQVDVLLAAVRRLLQSKPLRNSTRPI